MNQSAGSRTATGVAGLDYVLFGGLPTGRLYLIDGNPGQVLTQCYGVAWTLVYCAIVSFIILKLIDLVIGLRVKDEIERDGLDLALHGEVVP